MWRSARARFTAHVDNPWFPLHIGARYVYRGVNDGKASRDELTGSTITITSLGALGGLAATPVINYPEVAIVGVNRIAERPVVLAGLHGGHIAIRKMMNLSLSCDHRVVDGWDAALFMQDLKKLIENPLRLLSMH